MWRESDGKSNCNACRRIPPQGEDVYRGELTPAIWCRGCAEERGFGGTGDPVETLTAMGGLDKRQLAKSFPDFTAAMRQLRDKAKIQPVRSWHETEREG